MLECYIYDVVRLKKSDSTNNTTKMKNNTFASVAAPDAMPPNPKKAAIIAITKRPIDQRNINCNFKI
jgi:hypothetical protein